MSLVLGIGSNCYGATGWQSLPLNMVAAPTAVEDVNPQALNGLTGDGSVRKCDGSVSKLMGDGSVLKMDGSVKPGELLPAVRVGDTEHHSAGGGGGAGKNADGLKSFQWGDNRALPDLDSNSHAHGHAGLNGASDIPLDQGGGLETSRGAVHDLEPAALGGGGQSPIAPGSALPMQIQGKLELPFTQGTGRSGFTGGVDVGARGAFQPGGLAGGHSQTGAPLVPAAATLSLPQGALTGGGKTGELLPAVMPVGLGNLNLNAAPATGGAFNAITGGAARVAPVGAGITTGGAHSAGPNLAPLFMPGANLQLK